MVAGVGTENGFEVWRSVVLATTQKSQAEVLRLEDSNLMSDWVRKATDIEKALVKWDAMGREYVEAGGCALSDHRKVGCDGLRICACPRLTYRKTS